MNNTRSDGNLYCDTRIGGIKRWYIGKPKDANMRIADDHIECVCFLCVKVPAPEGEMDFFIGTCFFMGVPSAIAGRRFSYLVTARHVIEDAKAEGYTEFYIRLNTKDGSSITAKLYDDWHYPDNPAIDVAVIPFGYRPPNIKVHTFPAEASVTDELIESEGIGLGDDLYMLGLFNQRWGEQRNIPIIRTGVIAAMPEEPFVDDEGNLYEAYLVEMRSIGGLSGSPVFLYLDFWRNHPKSDEYDLTKDMEWRFYLLGVVRGHWNLKRQDAAQDSYPAKLENSEIDRLNTGIAQVTPIDEVLKLLYGETLMKQRKEVEARQIKQQQPTLDSNLPNTRPEGEEAAITQEGFEEALRRASRKTSSPPDEETKET